MEKMTVRKREKKLANVYQHKNMSILILNMHTNYATYAYAILLTGSTIPWSNWFYNIVRFMKGS